MAKPVEVRRVVTHYVGQVPTVVGPSKVEVHVVDFLEHHSSYYVHIDGKHQFGGFASHLDGQTGADYLARYGYVLTSLADRRVPTFMDR